MSGEFSYPSIDIPMPVQVRAFRGFEQILRSDPVLSQIVRTWVTFRGEAVDMMEPIAELCPYVRLSPLPVTSDWSTEKSHDMPMSIRIFTAVATTNFDEIGKLWAAIHTAVFPQDDEARRRQSIDALSFNMVGKPTLKLAAFAPWRMDNGMPMLVSEGSIELLLWIMT